MSAPKLLLAMPKLSLAALMVLPVGCNNEDASPQSSENSGQQQNKHASESEPNAVATTNVFPCQFVMKHTYGDGHGTITRTIAENSNPNSHTKVMDGDTLLGERWIEFVERKDGADVYRIRVVNADGENSEKTIEYRGEEVVTFDSLGHHISIRPVPETDDP